VETNRVLKKNMYNPEEQTRGRFKEKKKKKGGAVNIPVSGSSEQARRKQAKNVSGDEKGAY